MTDPTRRHAAKVLQSLAAYYNRRDARIRDLEAAGHRIVDGGPGAGSTDAAGRQVAFETTDWRTGEILVAVTGQLEDHDRALDAADPDDRWWHIDCVEDDIDAPDVVAAEGIPDSLGSAIRGWILSREASNEDIAEWSGWPLARVKELRALEGLTE
jgi:hypothetical protein